MTTSDVHTTPSASKNHNRRVAIVSAALVAGLLGSGALVLRGTEAVFSANTENPSNSWHAGSVHISDEDDGDAMFEAPVMAPGQTITRCIKVTYTGNVAAEVHLYGTSGSGNLGENLKLTINEGSGDVDAACTNFAAGTDVYTGTIDDFLTESPDYEGGVSTWTPNSNPTVKAYRFTVQLDSNTPSNQQGESATANFVWEAQAGSGS